MNLRFSKLENFTRSTQRLVVTASVFQILKANLKLSTKRLYGADGYAVREMLKLVELLKGTLQADSAAQESAAQDEEGGEIDDEAYDSYAISSKVKSRQYLRSEIGKKKSVY